tara:strand:- start:3404 stop:3805 length:402 start_codon:yes stop_codon:yes gene_type:complete
MNSIQEQQQNTKLIECIIESELSYIDYFKKNKNKNIKQEQDYRLHYKYLEDNGNIYKKMCNYYKEKNNIGLSERLSHLSDSFYKESSKLEIEYKIIYSVNTKIDIKGDTIIENSCNNEDNINIDCMLQSKLNG